MIAAAIVAFVPSTRALILSSIQQCNAALAPRRGRTAVVVGVLVAGYLLCFAYASRTHLFLKLNDEHAYMIQARMLAQGRLWMKAYPPDVSPFFDALSMIVDRVYAPMYFPGTALAEVSFVWTGLPYWMMPVVAGSVAAAFFYWIIAELFDPFRGLLAVLMLVATAEFRTHMIDLLAQPPFLVAEFVLLWGWLNFRRGQGGNLRWPAVIGAAAGYAAITRPLDALCVAIPVAIAIILQLVSQPLRVVRTIAAILIGAAPFLALMAIQNAGVTGHWYELAETYYNRQNFPASPMGFHHFNHETIPPDMSEVKKQWLSHWVYPSFQRHTPINALTTWYRGRLVQALRYGLPSAILCVLLPVSFLTMRDSPRRVMFGIILLFFIGYAIYLFFLPHYMITIMPSFICMIFMGCEALSGGAGKRPAVEAFLVLSLIAISISALWPIEPIPPDPHEFAQDQRPANQSLAALHREPAVVLFRFKASLGDYDDDPVYNDSIAWPDDAQIVRARDLGPQRNDAIVQYYAHHQPDRQFYIYDPDLRVRGLNPVAGPFGTAQELAAKPQSVP
jgi:hypothetical protein